MGAESCDPVDDLVAQHLAAVTTLLGQPTDSEQSARWCPTITQFPSAFPQTAFLHLCVVEVAEHTLQLLQSAQDDFQIDAVEQPRRGIEKVAQLLGLNAQLMESDRVSVLVDTQRSVGDSLAQTRRTS